MVELPRLLMGLAERTDVIVDFTNVPVGTPITLLNLGPDEPFGGGSPGDDFASADPATTGQVMELRVVPATSVDMSTPPQRLVLPPITPLVGGTARPLALLEQASTFFDAPAVALLGTFDPTTATATSCEWGVIAYPSEVTRLRLRFDSPGLFTWHCHIVEHEDNEMMRPYAIGPIPSPT